MLYRCQCKPFERYYRNWFLWYALLQLRTSVKKKESLTLVFILPGGCKDEALFISSLKFNKKIYLKVIFIEPKSEELAIKSALQSCMAKVKKLFIFASFSIQEKLTLQMLDKKSPTFIFGLDTDDEEYLLPTSLDELLKTCDKFENIAGSQFYFINGEYHLLSFAKKNIFWKKYYVFNNQIKYYASAIKTKDSIREYFKNNM